MGEIEAVKLLLNHEVSIRIGVPAKISTFLQHFLFFINFLFLFRPT